MPGADDFRIRRATPADAGALARGAVEGVAEYPSFAPDGWAAPPLAVQEAHAHEVLAADDVVCLVAEAGGEVIGQITLLPAARGPRPVADPALGHVSNLFVRRDRWGAGVAAALHRTMLDAARERGFAELRLFVAAGQVRARRFYEREGWRAAGEPFHDPVPGLTVVEHRRWVG